MSWCHCVPARLISYFTEWFSEKCFTKTKWILHITSHNFKFPTICQIFARLAKTWLIFRTLLKTLWPPPPPPDTTKRPFTNFLKNKFLVLLTKCSHGTLIPPSLRRKIFAIKCLKVVVWISSVWLQISSEEFERISWYEWKLSEENTICLWMRISLRNKIIEKKIFENIAYVRCIKRKNNRLLVKLYSIASKNNFSISTML